MILSYHHIQTSHIKPSNRITHHTQSVSGSDWIEFIVSTISLDERMRMNKSGAVVIIDDRRIARWLDVIDKVWGGGGGGGIHVGLRLS